jgi:hydrogenase-1 operon protein HyaF
MKPFPLPVVAADRNAFSGAEAFDFPSRASAFSFASLPEAEQVRHLGPALDLLRRLRQRLQDVLDSEGEQRFFDLAELDEENRTLVLRVLGEGEVGATVTRPQAEIRESVFPGIWYVAYPAEEGGTSREGIEIGAIPQVVMEASRHGGAAAEWPVPGAGVMNAPAVLAEVRQGLEAWAGKGVPHAVNLSLLPMSTADLEYLQQALGEGPVTIFSQGYGDCRIRGTAIQNLWRVRYFNSEGGPILDTLEIAAVPETALAAREDWEDSAARLDEVLEWFRG